MRIWVVFSLKTGCYEDNYAIYPPYSALQTYFKTPDTQSKIAPKGLTVNNKFIILTLFIVQNQYRSGFQEKNAGKIKFRQLFSNNICLYKERLEFLS